MNRFVRSIRALAALLPLCLFCALPARGAEGTAAIDFSPLSAEVGTGETVTLSVTVKECSLPVAGAGLTLEVADAYRFSSAQAGSGIRPSEFSYSYSGSQLILLYIDDDVGDTPAGAGAELAQITLTAAAESADAPLRCTKTDVAAAVGDDYTALDTAVSFGALRAVGEPVAAATPEPHYVEESQPPQALPDGADLGGDAAGGNAAAGDTAGNDAGNDAGGTVPPATPATTTTFTTDAQGNRIAVITPVITPAPAGSEAAGDSEEPDEIRPTEDANRTADDAGGDADADAAQQPVAPQNRSLPVWAGILLLCLLALAIGWGIAKSRKGR